jgi:hypothetical protein
MVVIAHDISPSALNWAFGYVIGGRRGLFPEVPPGLRQAMTFS